MGDDEGPPPEAPEGHERSASLLLHATHIYFDASCFPGVLFGTVLIAYNGVILVFGSLTFLVLFFLCIPRVRSWVIDSGILLAIGFAAIPIAREISRSYLFHHRSCMMDPTTGEPSRHLAFSIAFLFSTLVNFVLGVLSSVRRFLLAAYFGFVSAFRFDKSPFPGHFQPFDKTYQSFLALCELSHREYSLLYRAAAKVFMELYREILGKRPDAQDATTLAESSPQSQQRQVIRLRHRNRMWLAVLLSRNPSLRMWRRRD